MNINSFPTEVLSTILEQAAELNKKEGVTFTFGLCHPPQSGQQKIERYVRGPVPPAILKWDACFSLRQVCRRWHSWGLQYVFKDVFIKSWRGSERWLELPLLRTKYPLYEMVPKHRGEKAYRDPFLNLNKSCDLFQKYPEISSSVRRLWFDGLFVPETDVQIMATINSCVNLTSLTVPWTLLRHGPAKDWATLLGIHRNLPLRSLELLAVNLTANQLKLAEEAEDESPLDNVVVNFSALKRLKLFGDTNFSPIADTDLYAIARTATHLEEFQVTCMSTVSIEGVMAIVKASQQTLRLLEHSPRSQDGFMHPDPGSLSENEHICEILTNCPKLEDLSISIPSMCSKLFSNSSVNWKGDCQVRALHLCGHEHDKTSNASIQSMKAVLTQCRQLIFKRASCRFPETLTIELFFANNIFDPHIHAVHGEFSWAELISAGTWPEAKQMSRKGPYGSTGLYGKKNEEYLFDRVHEDEFFSGVSRTLLTL